MADLLTQEKLHLLLEALKSIVKLTPDAIGEVHDEWGEAACFGESQRIAANTLAEFYHDTEQLQRLLTQPMDW
jgi:hypothetical protein